MDTKLELIHLSPSQNELVDFGLLVFKVRVPSHFDSGKSRDLWILFSALSAAGVKKIMVDMSDMEFIDSGGIGFMIKSAKNLRSKKGEIIFSCVSSDIMKIFKVVKLHEFIKVFSIEAEALNFFRYL